MPTVLIAETDGDTAEHLARTLELAGYRPILTRDLRAALEELRDPPEVILLELNFAGGELLRRLSHLPKAIQIPVLGMTDGATLAARYLPRVTQVLCDPILDTDLLQAVERALAGNGAGDREVLRVPTGRHEQLIQRLLVEGPDPLAFDVCHRLLGRPTRMPGSDCSEVPTWPEIVDRAKRLGLLDAEEASILTHLGLDRRRVRGKEAPGGR